MSQMQLPSNLSGHLSVLKTIANYGFAGIGFFVMLYIVWFTLKDTAVDFTTVKAQNTAILDRQETMNDELVDMKEELIFESRKQTKIQERICINGAPSQNAAADCIVP